MTVRCPVCGATLDVIPGFVQDGRVFEFARCDNQSCPVMSVRIEWRSAPQ
jgi:hypothetical protein